MTISIMGTATATDSSASVYINIDQRKIILLYLEGSLERLAIQQKAWLPTCDDHIVRKDSVIDRWPTSLTSNRIKYLNRPRDLYKLHVILENK